MLGLDFNVLALFSIEYSLLITSSSYKMFSTTTEYFVFDCNSEKTALYPSPIACSAVIVLSFRTSPAALNNLISALLTFE